MHDYAKARKHMRNIGLPTHWGNTCIVAEALQRNISVDMTLKGNRKRVLLEHKGRRHRWRNGASGLNSRLAVRVTEQKDVTSRLMLNRGILAPENGVFAAGQESRALAWSKAFESVVIKPHDGNQGADVHVGIKGKREFMKAFGKVAALHGKVLVEQFHAGTEHRCLIVDNQLIAATRRRPTSVIGDGKRTINELVASKNQDRGRIHQQIVLGDIEQEQLRKQKLHSATIPLRDERVHLRLTSNIHTGGDAIDATDEISDDERAHIKKASRAIPGLRLGGFDVLLPRDAAEQEICIIEINAHPMISMHHFPWEGRERNVAGAIIDAMFPETKADYTS